MSADVKPSTNDEVFLLFYVRRFDKFAADTVASLTLKETHDENLFCTPCPPCYTPTDLGLLCPSFRSSKHDCEHRLQVSSISTAVRTAQSAGRISAADDNEAVPGHCHLAFRRRTSQGDGGAAIDDAESERVARGGYGTVPRCGQDRTGPRREDMCLAHCSIYTLPHTSLTFNQ